ncbi:TMhelix containing protein [Vibrio phage 2.096.O._10N.286.48.B5]|nr:TMhelix containing protein [Vibrio phage 2.096.O._10N.286.48.B5]
MMKSDASKPRHRPNATNDTCDACDAYDARDAYDDCIGVHEVVDGINIVIRCVLSIVVFCVAGIVGGMILGLMVF